MDKIQEILQTIESAERCRDEGRNNDRAGFLLQLATTKALAVIAQAAAEWLEQQTPHPMTAHEAKNPLDGAK
jgi:hypothetical protein